MSNNFYVGQKVVCVRDDWTYPEGKSWPYPPKGRVCTITEIGVLPRPYIYPDKTNVGIRVAEYSKSWCASYFRPAVERGTETGMTILRKIAKGDLVPA